MGWAIGLFALAVLETLDEAGAAVISEPMAGEALAALMEQSDVGTVGQAGSAGRTEDLLTLRGSGADIYDRADGFQFVHVAANQDCEIVARVVAMQDTDRWAKAGVMIRESLDPGSRHVFMALTPQMGLRFQRRTVANGFSEDTSGGSGAAPVWVKLIRRGNVFTALRSNDGAGWEVTGTETNAMGVQVYAGLAACAHNDGALTTATFDNVRLAPVVAPVVGAGDGLHATYFGSSDLASPASSSICGTCVVLPDPVGATSTSRLLDLRAARMSGWICQIGSEVLATE